jgi:phage terminase large subunit-like protein
VVLSLYTADPLLDPFGDKAIRQANPAFGKFLNAAEVRAMAEDARRMPSRESEYRNLVLNQRVQAYSPFVSRSLWEACAGPVADLSGVPVYGGLDLAAVSDLTAFMLIGRVDGVWHVRPTFWLPRDGLEEKSRKDRVPYDLWAKQGLLLTTPGRSVDYEHVAEYLRGVFDHYDVQKVGFDRWSMNQLRPRLLAAGFGEAQLDTVFVDFGQGTKSMTPALRELESVIRNGRLAHGGHPVLGMCAANAVVEGVEDARKLSKLKSNGRIDGMVALADAFGVAPSDKEPVLDVSAMIA